MSLRCFFSQKLQWCSWTMESAWIWLTRSVLICSQLKMGVSKAAKSPSITKITVIFAHLMLHHIHSELEFISVKSCACWIMSGMPVLSCEVFIHFLLPATESNDIMVPLNKIQYFHLLLDPRGIINCFMGFLTTAYFGLLVLKEFYCTSSAPGLSNPWCGWNWSAGGSVI